MNLKQFETLKTTLNTFACASIKYSYIKFYWEIFINPFLKDKSMQVLVARTN